MESFFPIILFAYSLVWEQNFLSFKLFHSCEHFLTYLYLKYTQQSTSRNLLTFVNPYIDAIIIIPFTEMMMIILSLESLALNRSITIAADCVKLSCSHISSEVHVRLCHRLRCWFPGGWGVVGLM